MNKGEHVPVLLLEALNALHVKKTRKYIDATLGAGGHAAAILAKGGSVLGIEADYQMIEIAKENLKQAGDDFVIAQGNFVNIDRLAKENGFTLVDGIFYDLGISSLHYKNGRGFSFENEDEPLDMRLDTHSQAVTAADLLNSLRRDQIEEMLGAGMELGEARRMAILIWKFGEKKKYRCVRDLVAALDGMPRMGKLHPATKVFAALRIAVNSELTNLTESLPRAWELIKPGGTLVVISFHSGEDRIVKQFMGNREKPVVPSEEELEKNPRARSAKMRVLRKEKNEI